MGVDNFGMSLGAKMWPIAPCGPTIPESRTRPSRVVLYKEHPSRSTATTPRCVQEAPLRD